MSKVLAAGLMYRPTSIKHAASSVYVVEQYNHRVSKWDFDPDLGEPDNFNFTLDDGWGNNMDGTTGLPGLATGNEDNFLQFPTGSAIDSDNDTLFVIDTLNHRVRVMELSTGIFDGSFGGPGTENGKLYRPAHADLSTTDDTLAVADSGNHRVSVFDSTSFVFLGQAEPPDEGFHTPYGVKQNGVNQRFYYSDLIRGKLYAYDDDDGTTYENLAIGTPGTNPNDPNELFYPGSASGSTGNAGNSFLTDTRNNKIKEFTAEGTISDRIVGAGTREGKFYYPQDTIGSSQGSTEYILVCNTLNNRIEVFDRDDDSFKSTFGSPTTVLS